ncbi:collagen alpha-1(XII) chain [Magallana gigas]|uniref:collagen alpha-1(XII) chain n=1 Tax=Magallana gigas TaxID=29159 RepID=UPI00333FF10F
MYRQEMDDIASQPPDQNVLWVNSLSELPEVGSAVFNKLSSPACPSRFDVAFVIDSSVSVGPHNFIRNFSSSVIEKLYQISRNNKFAIITFNSEANVAFSLGRNSDLNGLKGAIAGVRYKPGGTNTALALRTAHGLLQNDYGARRSAQDVVILVTDEASNIDAQETLPAAKELKDAGTHVIAIGMDLDTAGRAAAQEVKDIASSDDRAMNNLNSYSALTGIESDVINQMCEFGRNGRK